jgi:general secretion pathway protein G
MMRRTGFTLVELMIVVAILGILGAIVLPTYQGHASEAKISSAKSNLHALRAQIELYKLQHDGAQPGYANGSPASEGLLELQFVGISTLQGLALPMKTQMGNYVYGPYLLKIPENPFNNDPKIAYVAEATAFSTAADGTSSGWLYKKETGELRLNYPGTDSEGTAYVDY